MIGPIQRLWAWPLLLGVIAVTLAASQAGSNGAAWAEAVRTSRIDAATAAEVARWIRGAHVTITSRPSEGQPAFELVTISRSGPAASQQLIESANRSIDRLTAWFGPLPGHRLTIVDVPVHARLAGASYPGIAITSTRWLTTSREFASERALTVAIARQYALALIDGTPRGSWFVEGLAAYLATRAVHEAFEGSYYLTPRYFGGYLPHSIRAILMSPNPLDPRPRVVDLDEVFEPADAPWRLADGADRDRADRLTLAMHTLERFVGWPAFQAALSEFVKRHRGRTSTLQDFAAVLSEQRGADISWFFDQAMRLDTQPDYAVVDVTSVPAAAALWQTTVDVRRLGDATFDGTALPRAASAARSLPVLVRFADGSEVTEWIDGRDREWRFEYSSASPVSLASVDPGAILLLDADRTNNTRTVEAPMHIVGLRLGFNWLAWLQDAMLACTAVI